jgi:membrane fusion protein (multidrug efflux system)
LISKEQVMAEQVKTNSNGKRRRVLGLILAVFVVGAAGYGAWWALSGRYYESTDDAYVGGNIVQITPQVTGTVIAVRAEDTDFVKAGQPLVELDRADARVALEQTEAQLARTVRSVRTLFATDSQIAATVTQRDVDLAKAREDLARRERASGSGAVSVEEVQHARDAIRAAQAARNAAREQLAASRALVDRTTLADHPDVKSAAAKVREAYLSYARATLPAPVSGYVARRNVQVGQRVAAGAPLMAVVPLEDVWVDANFKESQLVHVRAGQPVTLEADLYGGHVEYHGTVAGFGAGTGAAFALLPPQNATGNWIKVVQRVPVRIALDAKELAAHPLQVGLSMRVEVDTRARESARMPAAPRRAAGQATAVFEVEARLADARVAEIIAANSPRKPAS